MTKSNISCSYLLFDDEHKTLARTKEGGPEEVSDEFNKLVAAIASRKFQNNGHIQFPCSFFTLMVTTLSQIAFPNSQIDVAACE